MMMMMEKKKINIMCTYIHMCIYMLMENSEWLNECIHILINTLRSVLKSRKINKLETTTKNE
jgi:hypothetical protein